MSSTTTLNSLIDIIINIIRAQNSDVVLEHAERDVAGSDAAASASPRHDNLNDGGCRRVLHQLVFGTRRVYAS